MNKDVFQKDLVLHTTSASIGRIQSMLISKKFMAAPRNNIFDRRTRIALIGFQKHKGWTGHNADGIPGPQTVALLGLTWHGLPAPVVAQPVVAPHAIPLTPGNLTRQRILDIWHSKYYGSINSGYCLYYAQALTGSGHRSNSAREYGQDYINNRNRGQFYHLSAGNVVILDNLNSSYAYGHAVASLGGQQVLSTDFPVAGYDRITTIRAIENGWGMRMQGFIQRIKP